MTDESLDLDKLEAEFFAFFQSKYVQRADARQEALGLQYTEAETRDLARETARSPTILRLIALARELEWPWAFPPIDMADASVLAIRNWNYEGPQDERLAEEVEALRLNLGHIRREMKVALARTSVPEGWRPIDSAPRDGTPVLVFVPRASRPENAPEGVRYIAYCIDQGFPFVHSWKHGYGPGTGQACGYPTHWQPLPAPPATSDGSEADGEKAPWITLRAERVLYVDEGVERILCDRLPSPVTLVVKLAGQTAG